MGLAIVDPKPEPEATVEMMLLTKRARLHSSMLKSVRLAVAMGISVGISFAAGACGNSDKPGTSTSGTQVLPTDGSTVSCTTDPRVDVYTANLKKAGERGVLTFTLVESNPAPPARGTNVLKMRVDMDGTAITGDGNLFASLKMPDHGHPTPVQPLVTFDASSATYTIDPAYLFMPGVWRLQFDAYVDSDAGVPIDTGVYFFCIEG